MHPAHDTDGTRRRQLARSAAVAATAGAVLLGASPAYAMTDIPRTTPRPVAPTTHGHAATSGEKPAVVGPLLDFFGFGAAIGAPLVCQAVTSGIGSGAGDAGLSDQAAPVIAAINDGCDTGSAQGTALVDQGRQMSQPLNAINPVANPLFDAAAGAAEQYGAQYDETLAPFGPTVRGSGATLRWFEGR